MYMYEYAMENYMLMYMYHDRFDSIKLIPSTALWNLSLFSRSFHE